MSDLGRLDPGSRTSSATSEEAVALQNNLPGHKRPSGRGEPFSAYADPLDVLCAQDGSTGCCVGVTGIVLEVRSPCVGQDGLVDHPLPDVWYRTAPQSTINVYIGLFALFIVVGGVTLAAGTVALNGFAALGGVALAAIGLYNGREAVYLTAHMFRIDETNGVLEWRSAFGRGRLTVSSLTTIRRAPRRPSVYLLESATAPPTPFWLMKRDETVRSLFTRLTTLNPRLDTTDLRKRKLLWWRGL